MSLEYFTIEPLVCLPLSPQPRSTSLQEMPNQECRSQSHEDEDKVGRTFLLATLTLLPCLKPCIFLQLRECVCVCVAGWHTENEL